MGSFGREIEFPIEWDVLVSVSESCLKGRIAGFIEQEEIRRLPASITWRLWTHDLGEYGTVEITKLRPGVSKVVFSGLGSTLLLTEEQRDAKKRQMRDVIDSYIFMLHQENIWLEDQTEHGALPETIRKTGRYRLSEEEIKNRKNIVKQAEKSKRENPDLLWEKIASDLLIPERTLRDWRHNPLYKRKTR